jgi:hypothetical protein
MYHATQHSNLWGLGLSATVWVLRGQTFVLHSGDVKRPAATDSTHNANAVAQTNLTCCVVPNAMSLGLQHLHPDLLAASASRHTYVGNMRVNGTVCRTFYSPIMASTFWDAPVDKTIILTEGKRDSRARSHTRVSTWMSKRDL